MELRGKELAKKLLKNLKEKNQELSFKPQLAVLLVGEDPASLVYVNKKIKTCEEYGLLSVKMTFPSDISQEEVLDCISALNNDPQIDGILLQLPLPKHLDENRLIDAIDPLKDVDGLTSQQAGLLLQARQVIAPCTPSGIIRLLKENNIKIEGQKAVVIGRSRIVGLPMFILLQQEGATLSLCHSKTKDISQYTKVADIVVVAVGKKEFFGKSFFSPQSVVIDVGIHRGEDNKLCGDVNHDEIKNYVKAYTPVPGGVGPLTIAMLLENTYTLAMQRRKYELQSDR